MRSVKGKKFRFSRVLLYMFITVFTFIIVFPYLIMLLTALKPPEEIYSTSMSILPETWTLSNFRDIWSAVPLGRYLKNTIKVASLSTLLTLVCAIPSAYAMTRMRFKGRKFFRMMIVTSQMFSPVVLLVGIYRVVVNLGLQNTHLGLVLVIAAFNQCFAVWMLSGTFATIPYDLEEAARIDGCTRMGGMMRIVLPLAAPGIVTTLIYVFINAWNEYIITLVLIGDSNLKTLNVGIRAFFGYTQVEWWYVFAASLITTLPVLILFFCIEKHMRSGLTAGGVKG